MDDIALAELRASLLDILAEIDAGDALGSAGQKTVELDQQSVGRLSRMDALQSQAMSKATQARRDQQKSRVASALARMDDGEYGYCAECGEDIPLKRLALDPTVPTCVTCARG
ncbi:TraR/DksA family transcriptional regulator [Candidatus Rhodobacter oscarellae]|nr:TraR/DksA family transcriptional regulator [Candidatus Rhodobacter lobularis]